MSEILDAAVIFLLGRASYSMVRAGIYDGALIALAAAALVALI